MSNQQKDEEIHSEYVYDKESNTPDHNDTIFTEPYYKQDSDDSDGRTSVNTDSPDDKRLKTSKTKRRKSLYDENHYALPDMDDDAKNEAEIRSLKSKLKAKEKQSFAWKTTSLVAIGILLLSVGANVYLATKIPNTSDNLNVTGIKL